MNNDWFFEKFALIADAPGAVERMRELVLDLAVRGKLMRQDPNEEPAKETLKRVDAEREQLVKAKGIRRHDTLGPVPVEAIPFAIPVNWQWCYLADVCFLITDGAHHTPQYLESGVPFLSVKDVSSGSIDFSSTRYISEEAHRELCKRCQPELGDVLLTKVGTTGIAVNVEDDRDFSIFVSLALLKFSQSNLDGRFLTYLINSPFVRQQSAKNTQGIGNKNLVLRLINRFIVPLPPLAEQKRIVAKVDELLGLCDALESQQQERELRKSVLVRSSLSRFAVAPTPENLGYLFHKSYDIPPSELRKSILTLAVQGKLVPQNPNDEPAEKILARIDSMPKRAMRTKEVAKEVDESTESEVLYDLPSGWQWVPFRRLPLQASVGIDRGRSTQGSDKAFGYFKMNNIRNSGGIDLSDLTRIDAKPNEVEAFSLANGDFLFNTRNSRERVGKTCVFRSFSDDPILYNNNILRVRFIDGFSPEFLDCWFRSPQGKAELEKLKSNTTNVCAIYQGKLSCFPCAIPPLAEQHRIVAKVDQLMALVDELERQQDESREKATKLLNAIVQEMTSGGQGIAATLES